MILIRIERKKTGRELKKTFITAFLIAVDMNTYYRSLNPLHALDNKK